MDTIPDQTISIIIGTAIGLVCSLITILITALLGFWKDHIARKYQDEKDLINRRRARKESRLRELEDYLKNSFRVISEIPQFDDLSDDAAHISISKQKLIGTICNVYYLGIAAEYGDEELDAPIRELIKKTEAALKILSVPEISSEPKESLAGIIYDLIKIYGIILKKLDDLSVTDTKLPGTFDVKGKQK